MHGATHRFEESDELRLVIHADSFGSAVAEAGRALTELVERSPMAPGPGEEWTDIEVRARDPASLLVEWLNELIFRAESEGWIAGEIQVAECSESYLRVRVRRRSWPSRTFPVKAATLDRAWVESSPGRVLAEVTLDV